MDNLITKKAQINKRTTRDNLSVLDCAFASSNQSNIKKLITHSEIDALAVSEVLRNAISSNNKTVVSIIFNEILKKYPNDILLEESLMAKFANLKKSDRDYLIRVWRVSSNLGSVKINAKNFSFTIVFSHKFYSKKRLLND